MLEFCIVARVCWTASSQTGYARQNNVLHIRLKQVRLNHAAIAGVSAAIDFLSGLGEGSSVGEKLVSAYQNISAMNTSLRCNSLMALIKYPA
jgi:hypothetical protein